jgi:hypothetical protein
MDVRHSWVGASNTVTQEFRKILRNGNAHYDVHKSLPVIPTLSHMNPVDTIQSCFCKLHFLHSKRGESPCRGDKNPIVMSYWCRISFKHFYLQLFWNMFSWLSINCHDMNERSAETRFHSTKRVNGFIECAAATTLLGGLSSSVRPHSKIQISMGP